MENSACETLYILFSNGIDNSAMNLAESRGSWVMHSETISKAVHKAEYMIRDD